MSASTCLLGTTVPYCVVQAGLLYRNLGRPPCPLGLMLVVCGCCCLLTLLNGLSWWKCSLSSSTAQGCCLPKSPYVTLLPDLLALLSVWNLMSDVGSVAYAVVIMV